MEPSWSDLDYDLLVLIAQRFNLLEHYLDFASVCKSWRTAATKANFNSDLPRVPWLMLAEGEEEEEEGGDPYRRFFSLYNGMILKKRIPKAKGKRCMDSSMGWLITVGNDDGEVSLLHPFSGVQIELPHQNTTENYEDNGLCELSIFFRKAVLSASPSHTSDYVLMVIEGNYRWLSFWRPGDLRWTRIKNETDHRIHRDLVYFNGMIYAVDNACCVLAYDLIETGTSQIVAKLPSHYNGVELYIVESLGELFVVVRDGPELKSVKEDCDRIPLTPLTLNGDGYDYSDDDSDDDDDDSNDDSNDDAGEEEEEEEGDDDDDDDNDEEEEEETYRTTKFIVYELDIAVGKLTETKELGDRALFLGANASLSVQASQFPGIKPNHIYFSDDCCERYIHYEEGGGLDMGVFNLADGTIKPHYQGVSLSRVCPPTWVTPTLF